MMSQWEMKGWCLPRLAPSRPILSTGLITRELISEFWSGTLIAGSVDTKRKNQIPIKKFAKSCQQFRMKKKICSARLRLYSRAYLNLYRKKRNNKPKFKSKMKAWRQIITVVECVHHAKKV